MHNFCTNSLNNSPGKNFQHLNSKTFKSQKIVVFPSPPNLDGAGSNNKVRFPAHTYIIHSAQSFCSRGMLKDSNEAKESSNGQRRRAMGVAGRDWRTERGLWLVGERVQARRLSSRPTADASAWVPCVCYELPRSGVPGLLPLPISEGEYLCWTPKDIVLPALLWQGESIYIWHRA